ncbi:hypothetical protein HK105_202182 [Polyrhizophydium stewartii]|uniref:Uncharacterized protein n=1 Tax=Polyrhizophydium stewartii TaxID=2732419 RepID=A0ABR4NFJ3_9FUNG|nr:hypothetical protein HK105_002138 [Polyrhizophydium stewartii]
MHPLVPVTLFVMSKCPDAVFCEGVFADVLQQVGPATNLTTEYIARALGSGRVQCLHGPSECIGNTQQLCARAMFPDPAQWFGFIRCQNRAWRSIPANSDACFAEAISPDPAALLAWRECVHGARGRSLLAESTRRAESAGESRSCTIHIAGRKRCVHDGDWKECDGGHEVADFVGDICAAAKDVGVSPLPAACSPSKFVLQE